MGFNALLTGFSGAALADNCAGCRKNLQAQFLTLLRYSSGVFIVE
jgi:hypothetical protein